MGVEAIKHVRNTAGNQFVLLRSDNTTAVSVVNKGYSSSEALSALVAPLSKWQRAGNFQVAAAFLPGSVNVRADALSRATEYLYAECILCKSIWQRITRTCNLM